jgi:alpha-1,2-rhamnosyltransferase
MRKLFIDVTSTYYSNLNTGIQRVVKQIVINKKIFDLSYFDEVIDVVQLGFFYCRIDNKELFTPLTKVLHSCGRNLRNLFDKSFNYKVALGENKHSNFKTSLHKKSLVFFRFILKNLFFLSKSIDALFNFRQIIIFNKTDILFIPDAFWDPSFSVNLIKRIKQKKNIYIILFIHDLFPLTHGELVDHNTKLDFERNFFNIIQYVDGFICNSKFSSNELKNQLKLINIEKYISFVHLGSNFNKNISFDNNELNNLFLMVGTLEPKKNHKFVIDCFEELWDSGFKYKLILIGRVGWKCNDIINKIYNSKYYNKYLFFYANISDKELINYYQKAKAVIIASIVEGYGLPLVEAIHFRKIVIASDIPIFREIGKDYPIFFKLNDKIAFKNAVIKTDLNKNILYKDIPIIPTWEDCVRNISKIIIQFTKNKYHYL